MSPHRWFSAAVFVAFLAPPVTACDGKKDEPKASKDDQDDDRSEKKKDKKQGKSSASAAHSGLSAGLARVRAAIDVTRPNSGTPEAPVTSPTQQTYSMAGIKTIPDTCANAHVILVTAPESVGVDYEWKYSRQAMLANQQYRVVDGAPRVQGEVSFQVHQADASMMNAFVLIANCADGTTCNHLAAMYKSIVKSSNPQVFCGEIPKNVGAKKKDINLMAGGPLQNLPKSDDTISKCARIAACTIADKTSTTEDVGVSCQKSPTSFKLECASRYPCVDVMSCLK